MTFQSSTAFNMGAALNKLRQIEQESVVAEKEMSAEPGMEHGGKQIDDANFTRTMARMQQIKDAVSDKHYNALRAGIRSLHMNRRPNLEQMSALMDLLETILGYVADDQTLFQRLKYDLKQDSKEEPEDDEDTDDSGLTLDDTEFEDPSAEEDEEDELFADEPRELKA